MIVKGIWFENGANQKAGIVTAWQGSGTAIPSECLYVRLARSNEHIAGLTSKALG